MKNVWSICSLVFIMHAYALDEQTTAQYLKLTNRLSGLSARSFALPLPTYDQTHAYEAVMLKEIRNTYGFYKDAQLKKHGSEGRPGQLMGARARLEPVILRVLAAEKKYKDTHYVFYHAHLYALAICYDLAFELCKLSKQCMPSDTFIMLRDFTDATKFRGLPTMEQWLIDKSSLQNPGGWTAFNFRPDIQPLLLSVNFSYYGNIGIETSNTFSYFIKNTSNSTPDIRALLTGLITKYVSNITKQNGYINRLQSLSQAFSPPEAGCLLQIFIRNDIVDELVYLARVGGYYWNFQFNEDYKQNTPDAKFSQSWFDDLSLLNKYWYRNTYYSWYTRISPILDAYKSYALRLHYKMKNYDSGSGSLIETMDIFQGRILLRGEYFAKPLGDDRILMYRYTTLDSTREAEYKKELAKLAEDIYNNR